MINRLTQDLPPRVVKLGVGMVIMTPVLPTSELILRFYQIVIVAIPVVTKVSLRPLNVYVQGVLRNSEIRLNNCQYLRRQN